MEVAGWISGAASIFLKSQAGLPSLTTAEQLEDALSTPTEGVVEVLGRLAGNLVTHPHRGLAWRDDEHLWPLEIAVRLGYDAVGEPKRER